MGVASGAKALTIFVAGSVAPSIDRLGIYHSRLEGAAAKQLAWQWTAVTLILLGASLAAWLLWERLDARDW